MSSGDEDLLDLTLGLLGDGGEAGALETMGAIGGGLAYGPAGAVVGQQIGSGLDHVREGDVEGAIAATIPGGGVAVDMANSLLPGGSLNDTIAGPTMGSVAAGAVNSRIGSLESLQGSGFSALPGGSDLMPQGLHSYVQLKRWLRLNDRTTARRVLNSLRAVMKCSDAQLQEAMYVHRALR